MASEVTVQVEGRTLKLTNLTKVLYPDVGFTKGEVIDYYRQVSDVLLPHLRQRLLTRKRWPDGTDAEPFFEKNAPRGTPDWVRTVLMEEHGDEGVEYVVCEDLPTLVWTANLAALELHVPQWRVAGGGDPEPPDLLVFDLDPGPPATVVECCAVAGLLRERLAADDLTAYPKTSGKKGAQLYVPVEARTAVQTSEYAKGVAEDLAAEHPGLVLARMDKRARRGKVFIDWSQNNPSKTTIAPYSLRGLDRPTVSTPVTWTEIEAATKPADLAFCSDDVLARIERYGDPLADMDTHRRPLR